MYELTSFNGVPKSNRNNTMRKTTNAQNEKAAALIFASRLLKDNASEQSRVTVFVKGPSSLRPLRFVVKRLKLGKTYYGGYKYLHYVST